MHKPALMATAMVLVAPILVLGSAPSIVGASGPQLSITAVRQVDVGQPVEIDVTLRNAPAVAGYEASVRYDEGAAEFGGVIFGDGSATGNVVTTITTDPVGGAAYSAYTCLAAGCPAPSSAGRGALDLVKVRLQPLAAGHVVVSFDQLKFVDLHGRSVDVDVPVTSVTVDVGNAGSSAPTFTSPPTRITLPADHGAAPAASSLDVNGDHSVTSADANELAAEWTDARRFDSCAFADLADPNGDGCLDVADLQLVGGSPASARAAATPSVLPDSSVLSQAATIPWVVNTVTDISDSNIGNGICADLVNAGQCSLRAAIQEANASPGPDVIDFNIPGAGVHTIQLIQQLPVISDASGGVTIDGYTQPGSSVNTDPTVSNAVIAVEVRGAGSVQSAGDPTVGDPTSGFDAFTITSANNVVRGLAIYNVFNHFEISGPGATGNVIIGNFIGSNAATTFLAPTANEGGSGVTMVSGSNHNVVGTSAPADRNVIGGTPSTGVRIQHEGTNFNTVRNNLFGLKPAGNAGLRLGFSGVDIQFGAKNNQVGGPSAGDRNVISGAGLANGVDLSHQEDTTGNRVIGNYIGTTPAGNATAAYTQNLRGVTFKDGVTDNFVSDNVIGGIKDEALWVQKDFNGENFVFNNHVGVALDGSPIPNAMHGMQVQGHDFQVTGNVFANNALGGVLVTTQANHTTTNPTIRNRISGNTFGTNGGLAIDLAPRVAASTEPIGVAGIPTDGPTPNDVGDGDAGPNTNLNYPVLVPASTTRVSGTACAACTVEVYKAVADTFGRGVGQKLIGVVTTAADGSFTATVAGVAVGDNVAAITIDAVGNTSEFSPVAAVTTVGPAPVVPPTLSPASFISLQPARLLETRPGLTTVDGLFQGGGLVPRGGTVELTVAGRGGVPLEAESVALNVTVTEAVGAGFVTVYPCGSDRPLASSLNFVAGETVPNAVVARVGTGGAVCLFVSEGTQLVVDVTGHFPAGSAFNSVVPARFLETRPNLATVDGLFNGVGPMLRDSTLELHVAGRGDVPADATAVVLNVTVTEPVAPGFVTVYPCGDARPLASNLNFVGGQTVPNQVIAKIGAGGNVCLYTSESTQVVADVGGYFSAQSSFISLLPARLMETRPGFGTVDGQFQGIGRLQGGTTLALKVTDRGGVSANADSVVLNVTATDATNAGFVTVFPCGQAQPLASSLNYLAGQIVPNSVIAKVGSGGTVCLFVSADTHLVVDVDGYFPPAP
jgi:CSLREA domain-containing protein